MAVDAIKRYKSSASLSFKLAKPPIFKGGTVVKNYLDGKKLVITFRPNGSVSLRYLNFEQL